MGWSSTKFHGKYAGMDSDNNITVTDIMRIVNIILSIKDWKLISAFGRLKIQNWKLKIDFGCADLNWILCLDTHILYRQRKNKSSW